MYEAGKEAREAASKASLWEGWTIYVGLLAQLKGWPAG